MNKINYNFWKNKNILITGHTGFKGSWLSLWLLNLGAKVNGISLAPIQSPNLFDELNLINDINHYLLDIRDEQKLKDKILKINPDIVFHLAAQPLVLESYKKPKSTWDVNVMGTINVLDSLRSIDIKCAAIFITTDKVYLNREWVFGYRENDPLGGKDPYSSSKAAAEIAISSWRSSFCGKGYKQNPNLKIASARAGNVIGGGDWSENRILPDIIKSLSKGEIIQIRNSMSTRPWQHVLEPLKGYMLLAQKLYEGRDDVCTSFNFGPHTESNKTVKELVNESLLNWEGEWIDSTKNSAYHEASLLNLTIEKAHKLLGWQPKWSFKETVKNSINWYKKFYDNGISAIKCCEDDIKIFNSEK